MDDALHVMPVNDLIEHEADEGCVCGPDSELVRSDNGDDWIIIHHSLDGRELDEPDRCSG